MFTIHFSNRFQDLRDHLLKAAAKQTASPFTPAEIVIPSAAVQRRLELSMAEHSGVCANVHFSYLGQWVWQQMGKIWTVPEVSPFAQETLKWRILRILENPAFVVLHARLRTWLANADAVMRYELAGQAASIFDQTMTYRPNLIDAWSSNKLICIPGGTRITGQDQQWQAELWRRILHETGSDRHLSAMVKKLDALDDKAIATLRRSGTTHIFCPTTIPPLTIEILNRFSQWMDLHLYVLNPCQEYWFDIVDRKRLSYLASSGKADHHETGNHLLASWGKQTQAMIDLLFDNTALTCTEAHAFLSHAENGNTSLLAQIQDAILELRDLPTSSVALAENDRSLEVHVCHSLTRELEVLQDQLLALFASDNPPSAEDVLVVTPNLKDAAPLIDAVFGTTSPSRHIPYTLTGLGNSRINPVATALLDLLSLSASRFTASAVFKLLQQPVVAHRFEFNEAHLNLIHRWMTESGMRWGLDAEHRHALQMHSDDRYTFSDGLHRLFLGYALPAKTGTPFGTRLPAGDIEGSDAAILGRFDHLITTLHLMQRTLGSAKTPNDWQTTLFALLDTFTAPIGNQIDEMREVRTRIRELCDSIQRGAPDYPVARDVIQRALTETFDDPARGGVPTGTVTFTSMTSLRTLPYKVICVIGMNDGAFPATQHAPEFDLIAQSPQRGDRQRRLDERNVFLDLLLAAQERFYLSYTGRDVRDNSAMPPSVLISDLLDYLTPALNADARRLLVIEHPLQAFSIDYYRKHDDQRLTSSNREYYEALLQQMTGSAPPIMPPPANETLPDDDEEGLPENTQDDEDVQTFATHFFKQPLATPDETWRNITLDQLLQFFRNPARYLLRHRLGIRFPEMQEELADEEPFLPERDEQRSISDRLLPMIFSGASSESILAAALAGTEYPAGALGQALLEKELRAMEKFAQTVSGETASDLLQDCSALLTFDIDGETWMLSHTFNDLRPEGLVRYRFDEVGPTDYLNGWITHLMLNAAAPANALAQTVWHSRDGSYRLSPVPDAAAQLQSLITLYRQGLCEPLHFYPRSAWEYCRHDGNLNKAETRWHGAREESFGEGRDPAYRQALRGVDNPLDAAFEHCAQTVFGSMRDYLSDPRLKEAS